MNGQVEKWTNPSVKRLAGDDDPIQVITNRARDVVLEAMDKGWSGPPFDSLSLSDASSPTGTGRKIIAQVVNDATPNWGGHGFAQVVKRRWPEAQTAFRKWAEEASERLSLGNVHLAEVDSDLAVASMVCQRGYGPSPKLTLRYFALETCLRTLNEIATKRSASVHMPRIGSGQAGGSWFLVQELISSVLLSEKVPVFIYDLPGGQEKPKGQNALVF